MYHKTNSASNISSTKNLKNPRSHFRGKNSSNNSCQKQKMFYDQMDGDKGNYFSHNNISNEINKADYTNNTSSTPKIFRKYNDKRNNKNGRDNCTDDESVQSFLLNNHNKSYGSDEECISGSLSSNQQIQSSPGVSASSLYNTSGKLL